MSVTRGFLDERMNLERRRIFEISRNVVPIAALRDAKSITLRIFIVKGDTFIRGCRQFSGKGLREADPNTIPQAAAFSLTTMRLFVMQLVSIWPRKLLRSSILRISRGLKSVFQFQIMKKKIDDEEHLLRRCPKSNPRASSKFGRIRSMIRICSPR